MNWIKLGLAAACFGLASCGGVKFEDREILSILQERLGPAFSGPFERVDASGSTDSPIVVFQIEGGVDGLPEFLQLSMRTVRFGDANPIVRRSLEEIQSRYGVVLGEDDTIDWALEHGSEELPLAVYVYSIGGRLFGSGFSLKEYL